MPWSPDAPQPVDQMTWTVGEFAQVIGIASVALTVLVRYVLRPQMRKGIEEAIGTERGIQAVIREKLPELTEIVAMREALNQLVVELGKQREDVREMVNVFTLAIRQELREISTRIDGEITRNADYRATNYAHTMALQEELDRLIAVAAVAATTAAVSASTAATSAKTAATNANTAAVTADTAATTAETGASLASTVARDADRRRAGDKR